jgi:hypothetical protein
MNVLVCYRTGVLLNYSLNAYSPYEGFRVSFTGDRGRIEYEENHGPHVLGRTNGNGETRHATPAVAPVLRVLPHFREPYVVTIEQASGGHGGADPLLQEQIFSACPPADPFQRSAGHEQGAASVLVGIAANESIAEGRPVNISDIFPLRPDAERLSQLV